MDTGQETNCCKRLTQTEPYEGITAAGGSGRSAKMRSSLMKQFEGHVFVWLPIVDSLCYRVSSGKRVLLLQVLTDLSEIW